MKKDEVKLERNPSNPSNPEATISPSTENSPDDNTASYSIGSNNYLAVADKDASSVVIYNLNNPSNPEAIIDLQGESK